MVKNNPQKRANRRGKANESRIADKLNKKFDLGAERVPLSGAMRSQKGDVLVSKIKLLIEAKVYAVYLTAAGARYVRFDLDWYSKIRQEATDRQLKYAAVFVRGEHLSQDYAIIPAEEYIELLMIVEGLQGKIGKK